MKKKSSSFSIQKVQIFTKMINLDHEPEPAYIRPYRELRLENKPISLLLLEATSKLRSILCNALNYEQILPNENNNLFRDYRGLAVILKAPTTEQRNIGRSIDPTLNILYYLNSLSSSKMLNQSINNNLISGHNQIIHPNDNNRLVSQFCKMELLMHALEKLGRFDVIDDLLEELRRNPIDESINYDAIANKIIPQVDLSDANTKYDAYISYADSDLAFVQDLCSWLESSPINLKLYLRARDLPLGTMEYSYFTELMENQCNRLIMILSSEFLSSAECEFQTKFTSSLQIEERQRKLIPIIHKPCKLPGFIKFLSKIDLSRAQTPQMREWTMEKLIKSLNSNVSSDSNRIPFQPRMAITNPPSLSIHTVDSSNVSDHHRSSDVSVNHSSEKKNNCSNNKKISKIKVALADGDNLNNSTSKLNSINTNDKSSNYSNSSPLNSRSITQSFSNDTDALIEELFSKVWKHLKFFKQ